MRQLILLLLFLSCVNAGAATSNPKRIFIHADCSGPLGGQIVTSLRDSIRASAGYELVNRLDDNGGYGVVITIYMTCAEQRLVTGEEVATAASIFGRATCTTGRCNVYSDEDTLASSLCSGIQGQACGKDLYTAIDAYMSGTGGEAFNYLAHSRAAPQEH